MKLIKPNILPDNSSTVFVDFDVREFDETQKVPHIEVLQHGKTLQVPLQTANLGFSGKYEIYVFNRKKFSKKTDQPIYDR